MNLEESHAQYTGLNPAIWRPPAGQGDDLLDSRPLKAGLPARVPEHGPVVVTATKRLHRRGSPDFSLPGACEHEDRIEFPEQARAGASVLQLEKASAMYGLGLRSKARRQASCRVFARMRSCENGHQHYQCYDCKNRYCPNESCGRKAFKNLFDKYMRLEAVAQQMVPDWENRPHRKSRPGEFVIAKIDITARNFGRMPSNEEVRQFNSDVRTLFRAVENEFWLTYPVDDHLAPRRDPRAGDYGVIWTDEFGGKSTRAGKVGNTNLHAHAVYCGPHIPQRWLSEQWAKIRGDGSKIVSIKKARTFRAGLYHALKYAGKFLSTDPIRLAELELAFNRVRRVHTMAGFYNAIPKDSAPKPASPPCPVCGGVMLEPTGPLRPVCHFKLLGIPDFEVMRREVARQKVLASSP